MQSAYEIFDVVNEHDEVIGQEKRGEVHRRGLKHRAVHVLVFDSRGRLYLQKRSMTKDTFPGAWDYNLGMNFNCSGENYLVGRGQALVIGERFQEEFGSLADVGEGLLDRRTLRLAALEFRTPSVASMLVLFDHHTHLAHHHPILSRCVCRHANRGLTKGDEFGQPTSKCLR